MIDKIKEAVILWKAWNCDLWVKQELKALLDLAERYLTCGEKMPAKKPETSKFCWDDYDNICECIADDENGIYDRADCRHLAAGGTKESCCSYRESSTGEEDRNKAIEECTIITTKLLAEKDAEIEQLKNALAQTR